MAENQDIQVDQAPPQIGRGEGPKPPAKLLLSDDNRRKLDDIVSKMVANKEKDEDIQAVVNDFKKKYAATSQSTIPSAPEHEIVHSPIHDIRHVQEMANKPVATRTTTIDPMSGGSVIESNPEEEKQNKAYKAQYDKLASDLCAQWNVRPEAIKQVLQDFPDEQDENRLKSHAQLIVDNPVAYSRYKNANDIRMAMAKDGESGRIDAQHFNDAQTSKNYQELTELNIPYQQQLIREHGLGQEAMDKLKETQRPLINSTDVGLLQKYWNSKDKEYGLTPDEYAGLETERLFNPNKAAMDEGILKHSRGIGEDGKANPLDMSTQPYAYQRGVENVKYNLQQTGRENLARYVAERKQDVDKQMQELRQGYNEALAFESNPNEQQRLIQEFNSNPIAQEANKLEDAAEGLRYSESEDQRRYPLNFADQATRAVAEAMDHTKGFGANALHFGGDILQGAGESADNTIRFVKNVAINLLGTDEAKAFNNASNIGHRALTELAAFEPTSYTGREASLIVPRGTISAVQGILNGSGSIDEKEQKAISYVRDHFDELQVNPKAGQQNLTGKAALFQTANMMGQILGVANQSFLLGGVIGDASKLQQMAIAFTPMYMSTQNQMYEQALKNGDEHPLLKSNIDAAIISLASLINPDIKVVKGMVGADTGIGKMLAGIDESAWNKVLSENKPWVDRTIAAAKATGRQLGLANLQYGLIVPSAQYLAHKSILNEDANLGDMIKDGVIQTSISMALPSLLHGVWGGVRAAEVNPPQQKYALVEAGLHPDQQIDLVDSQIKSGVIPEIKGHEMKQLIKHAGEILQNTEMVKTDGTPMNEKEVADTVYNMLRKRVLEGKMKTAAEPVKPIIEEKIHEINKDIADLHTSDADKQKKELNQLLHDNLDRIRDKMPTMEQPIKDAIAENRPEDVFKEIASQATETTKVDGKEVSSRPLAEEIFGKPLVEKAIELSKQKTKTNENSERQQADQGRQVTPTEGAVTQPPAPSFLQSRHADTIHDEQGIVSGPNNKELSAKGKRDANDLAEDVKDKGVTIVVTSGLERSKETGERVAEKIGAKIENRPKLNTWGIKDFDGLTDEEFKEVQKWFTEHPDAKIYTGPEEKYKDKEVGESINEYANRIIPEMTELEKQYGPEMLLINHSNNMMLWDAYLKNGREWNDQARQDYINAKKPEPATLTNKTEDNASSIRSDTRSGSETGVIPEGGKNEGGENLQQPTGQKAVNAPTEQQGGQQGSANTGPEQPTEGGAGTNGPQEPEQGIGDLPFGDLPVGIAHHLQEERAAAELNVLPPERGEGITLEQSIQRGKDLIAAGVNPGQVAANFKKDNRLNSDDMSVVRARYNELANKTNKAYDQYGEGSPQAIAAFTAERSFYNDAVKPMQTEWSKIGVAQQSSVDLDTGTITSIKRAFQEQSGKPLTEKQSETAKNLHDKIKEQDDTISDLQKKLDAIHNADQPKKSTTFSDKAKKAADIVRKLKNKEFTFKDSNGNDIPVHKMGVSWNDVVEFGAKAIEKTGEIADGIAAIIDKVKDADWYRALSKEDKDRFGKELEEHYINIADKKEATRIKALEKQLSDLESGNVKEKGPKREPSDREKELKDQIFEAKKNLGLIKPRATPQPRTSIDTPKIDIATHFVDKKDNAFTPNESKAIWGHAKEVIKGGKSDFHDVVSQVAMDTGLSNEQVRRAISQPKGAKVVTDKMYAEMYKRNQILQSAKIWVKTADQSASKQFWNKVIKIPSAIVTFAHGSVAPITHVGADLYRPTNWESYFNFMLDSYKFSFGGMSKTGKARYEKAMGDLVRDPLYTMAKRAGLKIDPTDISGDDYSKYQGVFGRLAKMGERGFNAMKPYRLEQFKKLYNKLSDQAKADQDVVKAIAHGVNLSSGTTDAEIPKGADVVLFAPKLVLSQYQRIFSEPAKAINTLVTWGKATDAEKLQAKMVARHTGEMVATYMAMLAANQAILSMSGSKQAINFTNPMNSDWMKFKVLDKTVDASGGMNSALRFVGSLVEEGLRANGIVKTSEKAKPGDVEGRKILQQMSNKLSPAAADVKDVFTTTDMMGNPLPWSAVKPSKGKEQLTWGDYLETKLPIPLAEGIKTFNESAKENGMPESTLNSYWEAVVVGVLTGTTGAKISNDNVSEKGGGATGGGGAGSSYSRGGRNPR